MSKSNAKVAPVAKAAVAQTVAELAVELAPATEIKADSPVAAQPAQPAKAASKAVKPQNTAAAGKKKVTVTPSTGKKAVSRAQPKSTPEKKPVAPAASVSAPDRAEKTGKPKKPKLVRDSFTMPEDEYEQITLLKKRLLTQGIAAKKSEILRAGLTLLSRQGAEALIAEINQLKPVKTGRPAK